METASTPSISCLSAPQHSNSLTRSTTCNHNNSTSSSSSKHHHHHRHHHHHHHHHQTVASGTSSGSTLSQNRQRISSSSTSTTINGGRLHNAMTGNAANAANAPSTGASQGVPSKRDKRRIQLADKLNDLSTTFDRDRDIHYRNQVAALQQDFNAIARADTSGQSMRMLDDSTEGIDRFVTGELLGQDGATMSYLRSTGPSGPGMWGPNIGPQPGSFYAAFVAEVNEKMEERDTALTLLHRHYHTKLNSIKAQHERSIHHAREEHINLATTMKQRLINRLYNAKKKLSADKEHLDVADTSALLLHPNQYSLGVGPGGVLGSPGGKNSGGMDLGGIPFGLGICLAEGGLFGAGNGNAPGGRRKLRQRRGELEDLMMMNQHQGLMFEGSGDNARNNSKRKSRAARSSRRNAGEDDNEEDLFGPGTATPQGGSKSNSAVSAAELASILKQQKDAEQNSMNGNMEHMLHKPVYSIDKLFTDKELQMASNIAAVATVKYFSAPERTRGKKKRKGRAVEPEDAAVEGGSASEINEAPTDGVRTPHDAEVPLPLAILNNNNNNLTISGEETNNATNATTAGLSSTNALPEPSNSTLLPAPVTIFREFSNQYQQQAQSTNPRTANISKDAAASVSAMNLNNQPPPSLAHLSFMTPSQYGYGSAAWTALGVPSNFFSAGNGGIVNSTKSTSIAAPNPPGLRADEMAEDLEIIRGGVYTQEDELEAAQETEDESDQETQEDERPKIAKSPAVGAVGPDVMEIDDIDTQSKHAEKDKDVDMSETALAGSSTGDGKLDREASAPTEDGMRAKSPSTSAVMEAPEPSPAAAAQEAPKPPTSAVLAPLPESESESKPSAQIVEPTVSTSGPASEPLQTSNPSTTAHTFATPLPSSGTPLVRSTSVPPPEQKLAAPSSSTSTTMKSPPLPAPGTNTRASTVPIPDGKQGGHGVKRRASGAGLSNSLIEEKGEEKGVKEEVKGKDGSASGGKKVRRSASSSTK